MFKSRIVAQSKTFSELKSSLCLSRISRPQNFLLEATDRTRNTEDEKEELKAKKASFLGTSQPFPFFQLKNVNSRFEFRRYLPFPGIAIALVFSRRRNVVSRNFFFGSGGQISTV